MSDSSGDGISQMCAIWGEVLGTHIEPEDDFFAVGGDSLSAVQIELLVDEQMGLSIGFRDFFSASTPRSLVEEALARSAGDPGATVAR